METFQKVLEDYSRKGKGSTKLDVVTFPKMAKNGIAFHISFAGDEGIYLLSTGNTVEIFHP